MCCNGVLFQEVNLQADDSPRALAALGLKPKRRAGTWSFPQPCKAHENSSCRIYADRPHRCRAFSCKQLDLVSTASLTTEEALRTIDEARRRTARVLDLLALLGDSRMHRSLATRVAAAFTDPLDPSPGAAALRDELLCAMQELEGLLAGHFRKEPAPWNYAAR